MTVPLESATDEASRITDAAAVADVTLRITGGVGIALRCPSAAAPPLARSYSDIDCVARASQRREVTSLLSSLDYQADQAFNALHGHSRLFFWDTANNRQLDVFLDRVEMCHSIDLVDRLDTDPRTLSLADLLLMKLQVFETNEKDLIDIVTLFSDHALTTDDSGINIRYIARLTADDWGLWRTTTIVAGKADGFTDEHQEGIDGEVVHARIGEFLQTLERETKSRRWKLRAKIGERKRWYELPEESH